MLRLGNSRSPGDGPFILRPRAASPSTYAAESLAYFSSVEAVDADAFDLSATNATATTSYTKAGHDELIKVLKGETTTRFTGTSSIGGDSFGPQPTPVDLWSTGKITEAYVLAGVKSVAAAAIKLKGTGSLTNNNFLDGDITPLGANAGMTGDGSSKYLDTGLNDNTLSADDKSFGGYTTAFGGASAVMGVGRASAAVSDNDLWLYFIVDSTNWGARLPADTAGITSFSPSTATGLLVASRRGTNDAEVYVNSVSRGTDTSTTGAANAAFNWHLLATNLGGSVGEYGNHTLAFAHIGTGLTDTEAAYLSWCVNAWMTYFGANTYVNS